MEMGDDTVYEAEKQRSKEAKKQRKAYTEIAPTGSG